MFNSIYNFKNDTFCIDTKIQLMKIVAKVIIVIIVSTIISKYLIYE